MSYRLPVGFSVLILMAACNGQHTAPTPTPSSLAVTCDQTALSTIGQQGHCQARLTLSNATVEDQTASAQWSSSDPAKVSAAAGGVVTAVAAGAVDITATVQGLTGRRTIAVNLACAFSISPATLSFPSAGGSQIVTVTVTPTGCAPSGWSASATDAGLTFAPAAGDGSGPVTVTAGANTGSAQIRNATIAGQPLIVSVAAPPANSAPTVTVTFDGASDCTPLPKKPCTLSVSAAAVDPDGDPLTYAWSGCASGTLPRASCSVERPGAVQASVTVSDNHAHSVTASITAAGNNRPPGVQIGYIVLLPSGQTLEMLGNVVDPDEGFLCGPQYCTGPVVSSGACGRASQVDCTCLGGLVVDVQRTASTGLCTVTFTLQDSWGQRGTPSITFDVATLKMQPLSYQMTLPVRVPSPW